VVSSARARSRSTSLGSSDDHTVAETLRVYGQMAHDYRTLFAEQGRRWQAQATLTTATRHAVDAYAELVEAHLAALDDLLALTKEIQGHTIEKIMATSDLELGIEALLGHLRPRSD